MPNLCNQALYVKGSKEEQEAFFKKHILLDEATSEHTFDFGTIIKVPEDKKEDITWRKENWGCAFNPFDVNVEKSVLTLSTLGEDMYVLGIYYWTAWSPPEKLYEALFALYPNLPMSVFYFEPGCCFAGCYENNEGVLYQRLDSEDIDVVNLIGYSHFGYNLFV